MYDLICFLPLAFAILALWIFQAKASTDFPEVLITYPDGTTETAFVSATKGDGRHILIDSDAMYLGTGFPDGTIFNRPGHRWELI